MIKLIIFDWDDVFTLGAKEGYIKCYHEALIGVGVHLNVAEEMRRILSKWSRPHREELGELLKERPELIDRAVKIYEEKFFGGIFVNSLRIVEGSSELLMRLKNNYKLAISSGVNPTLLKNVIFPKFVIPDVFSEIITNYDLDDSVKSKPHPFMLEEIMRRQNISNDQTVMVGDAKTDVQMAQNAGVIPIVVLTGHLNREQAKEIGVKYIIEDVTKLEEVLTRLNQSAS